MQTKIDRAKQLVEEITYHDKLYFTDNKPVISDEAYDALWFELRELLEDDEVKKALKRVDMPLGEQNSYLAKVQHLVKVLSLDKMKSHDKNFRKNLDKFLKKYSQPADMWVMEPKLDGLTIVIYKFSEDSDPIFVTRGAGQRGENVTDQFRHLKDVWNAAQNITPGVAVRGEAVISYDSFSKVVRESADGEDYANPRNLASASVRTNDVTRASRVGVQFVAYDLMDTDLTEIESLNTLKSWGFEVVTLCASASNMIAHAASYWLEASWREKYPWPIDGIVLKPDVKDKEPKVNGHHQLGQLAIKYPPKGEMTIVRNVDWTCSQNGKLTPVAEFDPVVINGAVTKRASLGSYDTLQKLGLKINSRVFVVMSNDVIPQVQEVIEPGDVDIELPEGAYLDGKIVYAGNIDAPLQDRVAKMCNAIGVNGFSVGVFKKFVDAGLIDSVVSVFKLPWVFPNVKGISEVRYRELLEELSERLKSASLSQIIVGFDVKGLGKSGAQIVEDEFHTLQELVEIVDTSSGDERIDRMNDCMTQPQIVGFDKLVSEHLNELRELSEIK